MYRQTLLAFTQLVFILTAKCHVSLMDHLNFLASQSQYAPQAYGQLQAPFSLDNIMGSSLELAVHSCQTAFAWDRWNCPATNFFFRRNSKAMNMDLEDAYVKAITTAAVLFTITKNCSSGIVSGCGSCSANPYTYQCSDDPQFADQLFQKHVNLEFANDFYGKVSKHNYKAITNLLKKSLIQKCICSAMGQNGICRKEMCLQILKPFEDIARDIRQMYNEGLKLTNTPENSRIMWKNIPLDSLIYIKDSPNYCEPDAMPLWDGMRGRQCTTGDHGETLSEEERQQCRHLCQECGYTVRSQNVVRETRCNCKFTWGFQVQCDTCVTVQRQYYCY